MSATAGDVPGYELEDILGSGSMGTVFRARQRSAGGRVVALKRLPGTGDPELVERLRREGQVLAALDHPHIVRVLDLVEDGGGLAIAMAWAPGGSLADLLARRGRCSPAETVGIAAPIAEALASAHRHGVLHRDVKPANVLFTSDGEPLLSDFGTARWSALRPLTVPGAGWSTAEYLDPAVGDGADADERSDIYSLGVVCYELLTGQRPFKGSGPLGALRAADRAAPIPLTELAPETPLGLAEAVERALARQPRDRFPTADAFAAALRTGLGPGVAPGLPTLAHLDPPPRAGPPGQLPSAGVLGRRPNPPGLTAAPHRHHDPAAGGHSSRRARRDPAVTGGPSRAGPGPGAAGPPTRSFGPRPPRDVPVVAGGVNVPWRAVAAVALALLVVPVGLVGLGDRLTDPPSPGPAQPAVQVPPTAAGTAPCPATAPPTPAAAETVLVGDLAGDGCRSWVRWRGNVLDAALDPGSPPRVFELGLPGDALLLGDWNCDASDTPGLYRPSTGEVFLFDEWAREDTPLASRAATDSGVRDGVAAVVDSGPCDRLEVRPAG